MVLTYGVKFTCDCCGAGGAISDQYPAGAIRYDQMPVPEGWVDLGLLSLMITDPMGRAVIHLCGVCGGLGLGQLAERLKARFDRERVRT